MISSGKSFLVSLMALLLILTPAISPTAWAQTPKAPTEQHVVSSAALQRAVAASVATRRAQVAQLESFLSTPAARRAMRKAGLNYRTVRHAIPLLSQEEVANLAARAGKAQQQFKAGALTNQQLTYIIIALATAIIVVIILKA
jgi:pyruvate/2-oxoglutarate dehydrogenase complex dihydrolipoamide acyltransferase (E2) component